MRILAIDQSISCSGWCLSSGTGLVYGVVKPPKFDASDPGNLARFRHVHEKFSTIIDDQKPEVMVLERYFPGTRGQRNGMTVVPELRGVLKLLASSRGMKFMECAPQTVRCTLLGKGHGHANKEEVADWVEEEFGIRPEPLDITDSIAMAEWAQREVRNEANKIVQTPRTTKRRNRRKGNKRTKGGTANVNN